MDVSKIKYKPVRVIFDGLDLGVTDAPVEFERTMNTKEVTCDQYGDDVLAEFFQSESLAVKAVFKEIDSNVTKKLFGGVNEIFTPDGGTEVIGGGTSKAGTNLASVAKKLVLRPLNASDSDHSEDICFWLAYAKLTESLKYSGGEEFKYGIEFKPIIDPTKDTKINKYVIGDWTQFDNLAPTANNLFITGTLQVGQELTGHYNYSDAEGDVEGTSTFKWYRSDNIAGLNKTAISGATALTYTLQGADEGKHVSFEVTPVDENSNAGDPVESSRYGAVAIA